MKHLTNKANLIGGIAGIFGLGLLLGLCVPSIFVSAYGLILGIYGLCMAFIPYAKDLSKKKKQNTVNTECMINQYRQNRNMSIEQLAEQVKVSPKTIYAIENNRYTPSVNLASEIAKVFNVGIDSLFKPAMESDRRGAVIHGRTNL